MPPLGCNRPTSCKAARQQTSYSLGVGATWLVNRRVQISATYDLTGSRVGHRGAAAVGRLHAQPGAADAAVRAVSDTARPCSHPAAGARVCRSRCCGGGRTAGGTAGGGAVRLRGDAERRPLVRLARDPGLAAIYRGAVLRLLDSRVVAGAAAVLQMPVPHVAPGSDVTALLLTHHLLAGERITIVGLRAGGCPRWWRNAAWRRPRITIRRWGLRRTAPRSPRQWRSCWRIRRGSCSWRSVRRNRRCWRPPSLRPAVPPASACASAPAWSSSPGVARRAPRWMQRCGLEWLFRLCSDPRRLARRYLIDSPAVLAMLLRARLGGGVDPPAVCPFECPRWLA